MRSRGSADPSLFPYADSSGALGPPWLGLLQDCNLFLGDWVVIHMGVVLEAPELIGPRTVEPSDVIDAPGRVSGW